MRILVCGGRDYADRATVRRTLAAYDPPGQDKPTLVHGACNGTRARDGRWLPGADKLAAHEAHRLGWNIEPHPANWKRYGKVAGPLRNRHMATLGADVCLAFPGGKGTHAMIEIATAFGIPVRRI